jgi:tRNA-splicing ligase RtcB
MPASTTISIHQRLEQVEPFTWELPADAHPGMRVPARIYADDAIVASLRDDLALEQLANVATLPGIVGFALAMPDIHQGYGFPVGAVCATELPDGVISPGGVGYDINCGVRLLTLDISQEELGNRLGPLMTELSRSIPSGTGRGGRLLLDGAIFDRVLREGSHVVVDELGLGTPADVLHTESGGRLAGADPAHVSSRARERGHGQLGTLGSGNHFIELQRIDQIVDPEAARAFGLVAGQVTALIHTGSRGLGHQVCTDHVRRMLTYLAHAPFTLPDRQLACAPASTREGQEYLAAMACAANFAWANRQVIAHRVRQSVASVLGRAQADRVRQVYDVAHNVAKEEEHLGRGVLVQRKGATRAFGPGRADEFPADFAAVGQPVFIPGSMGTASWVLAGSDGSEDRSFGTTCHGAGRALSRTQARRRVSGGDLRRQLEAQGIAVRCGSARGLAEEAPFAYKDVDRVVDVVDRVGIARKVARLVPIGVVKG